MITIRYIMWQQPPTHTYTISGHCSMLATDNKQLRIDINNIKILKDQYLFTNLWKPFQLIAFNNHNELFQWYVQ
jgi:hypothetical protein